MIGFLCAMMLHDTTGWRLLVELLDVQTEQEAMMIIVEAIQRRGSLIRSITVQQ
jgi:hypothetical protein